MMIEWIERKKRKYSCKAHFDDNSFRLNDCVIAPVHIIPDEMLANQECDFYLQTRYDVYLLRLTNNTEKYGTICPASRGRIVYIVCFLPISKDTITTSIQNVIHSLEQYVFPNIHNPTHETSFTIEC